MFGRRGVARAGDAPAAADYRADLHEAYERGRREERAGRRRHPIGMTLTFALALVGVVVLVLAAINGSFGGAGQTIDRSLTRAGPVASQAASAAGEQVRDATSADTAKPSGPAG